MKWLVQFGRLDAVLLVILLGSTFQGALCQLSVSPAGPTVLEAVSGSTVILQVSFSGAPDPEVHWSMGTLPVVTWTIGSPTAPTVAADKRDVLRLEANGSLTFVNVQRRDTSDYTVEMTKSGVGKGTVTFSLTVFEIIQDVTLHPEPEFAKEGSDPFTIRYRMLQGVVQQETWFFNDMEIQTNSQYTVGRQRLVIPDPNRTHTGEYALSLKNPFSSVTTRMSVSVLYGPDDFAPVARPDKPFYEAGEALSLSCQAEGNPEPTAQWVFGGQNLNHSRGVLDLKDIKTSQGGVYTCTLVNNETKDERSKSKTLNVYERPAGDPVCSVESDSDNNLQYHCRWPGGTPEAELSFPMLGTSSGAGTFSHTVTASNGTVDLNGKIVTCTADHPLQQNSCGITASSPVLLPVVVRSTEEPDGQILVSIHCVSEASPQAVVSWLEGTEPVTSGTPYQIGSNTTRLDIRYSNVSNFLSKNLSCTSHNPLGSQRREILLGGPSISDSRVSLNQDGTVATLTWEVPPTSIVTGFNIQIKGPPLLTETDTGTQSRGSSDRFATILEESGFVRSTTISSVNPKSTYRFRIIPKALATAGDPSEVHRTGPGEGLSGPVIAGIAAGIPCGILFLLLLAGLIYLCCYYFNRSRSRQARYPVSRAVEKVITTNAGKAPHNLMSAGQKAPPDYNRLHQVPSERSVALPSFVPPTPVRVATTV